MTEAQIKKAVKAGNSSAVILPRAWLNKEVRVELARKTHEMILLEVINILNDKIPLKEVIGIYLAGSYARGEEDENSDIDVLVITNGVDKETISDGIYNILIVSSALLKQKLEKDLLPLGQMIREAKALLNESYLENIHINITERNVKWHINTTEDKLKIIGKIIMRAKKGGKIKISDRISYTLILRIRTLEIIEKLIKNKDYSKKEFVKLIDNISEGKEAYGRYLAVKNNEVERSGVSLEEIEKLYNYLEERVKKVKKIIEKRK